MPPPGGPIADGVRGPEVVRQAPLNPSENAGVSPPGSVVAQFDVNAGAPVVPRPFQDRQVPVPRGPQTGLAVPGASVLTRPPEES